MSEKKKWAEEVVRKIEGKIEKERVNLSGGIPYIPENNRYIDVGATDLSWWTNGFWGGLLWQLYGATQKEGFKESAVALENRLDQPLEEFEEIHHDVGFMWLHTSVAQYRQLGSHKSYQRSLHAATILAGRFNLAGQFLRCWNEDKVGWVIIDSMMNIPLLYWASSETNDPRFSQIAEAHSETVRQYLVRKDGSVNHIGVFDPESGTYLHSVAGQGYAADSSWSRGQGWAIYGFALSYKYSQKMEYLETAKQVANYVISQLQETNYLAKCDYRAPSTPEIYDSTASVITACGLLEIANWLDGPEKEFYTNVAFKILLAVEKIANWNPEEAGIIPMGTVQYHSERGRHVPIIYGDYFFTEGILRLLGRESDMW